MRRMTIVLALVGSAGCGADPFLGQYAFTDVRATMLTEPLSADTSAAESGTMMVAPGSGAAGYALTLTFSGGTQPCTLGANKSAVGQNLAFTLPQSCSFSGASNTTYT